MNIFVLDIDPKVCASYHCDKHVVKMVLETAQILSSALHINGVTEVPYKPTHLGHPCVKWAASSRQNFNWLLQLGFWLSTEYTTRYGKVHKSEAVIMQCNQMRDNIPDGPFTLFEKCCPDEFKKLDVVDTYRNYYKLGKGSIATYKYSPVPQFMK